MKRILSAAFLLAALATTGAQTTTKTECQQTNNTIDCTTTDTANQQKADKETADALIGKPIMAMRVNHGVKKYCKAHPGEPYHWTMPDGTVVRHGICPK